MNFVNWGTGCASWHPALGDSFGEKLMPSNAEMMLEQVMASGDDVENFRLLQARYNVDLDNTIASGGMNILHEACSNGWIKLAKELLKNHGMNVNQPDIGQTTPLMHAVNYGHMALIKYLLRHPKMRINQKDVDGMTAAHWAVRTHDLHRESTVTMMRMLIQHEADMSHISNDGRSILAEATEYATTENTWKKLIKFLILEAGCEVTSKVLAKVKKKNPESVALCKAKLEVCCTTPDTVLSLKVQARAGVWRMLNKWLTM